jgi:uncharacterized protein YrzB (UPF0473 family)
LIELKQVENLIINNTKKRGIIMAQDPILENDTMEPQEEMTVTLTLDDGSELECVVLTIFTAGERDYIALLPMEGPEAEEGEVYLYRYNETEDGQPDLENIEDDDEYEIVADAFDEMLDDAEYDEVVGDDEE